MSTIRFSKIKLLETGYNPATLNMAIDETLMETRDDVPVLRIYGWKPGSYLYRIFSEHER